MKNIVSVDNLADAIMHELSSYSDEVTEKVLQGVDIVAKEVNEEIKSHITFEQPTGKYVKAFRIKKTADEKHLRVRTWYVAAPYYRLTHLLENGHAKRGGGRTRAFPHIKYGDELAQRRMEQIAQEAIEGEH